MNNAITRPLVPKTFGQYVRSMGPGLVVALTWLGAGDLVDSSVASGQYGYGLMWAMVIALLVRFVFVSLIAKYHLCNQRGESVIAGLKRVHRLLPLFVGLVALVFGHFYGSYLIKGTGETTTKLLGVLPPWAWSVFWVVVAAVFLYRGAYRQIEIVNGLMAGLFALSVLGAYQSVISIAAAFHSSL
jgi:Mn2+/Fe2+ NRAMP family transporter